MEAYRKCSHSSGPQKEACWKTASFVGGSDMQGDAYAGGEGQLVLGGSGSDTVFHSLLPV